MKLELDHNPDVLSLGYIDLSTILVNGAKHKLPIALTADKLLNVALPSSFEAMQEHHWIQILNFNSSVILCGTGCKTQFLPIELEESLMKLGGSIDVMTTQAACQTFSLLSTDNRDVIAILFGS